MNDSTFYHLLAVDTTTRLVTHDEKPAHYKVVTFAAKLLKARQEVDTEYYQIPVSEYDVLHGGIVLRGGYVPVDFIPQTYNIFR